MKFIYCPYCGEKLIEKMIGDEGMVPYCKKCEIPLFDVMYSCILALAVNELNEVALIRQSYVSNDFYIGVAGYLKSGESAEEAAVREVEEELGLSVSSIQYIKSYYYEKKDMLMLGFIAKVKKDDFKLSEEVDSAKWFPIQDGLHKLSEGSIVMELLMNYMEIA